MDKVRNQARLKGMGAAFICFLLLSLPCRGATELNVITSLSASDPMYQGLLEFKRIVETESEQSLRVRIFVGSQLGNDDDMLEQAMAGANVAVLADGGRLSVYSHELGILGAPYLVPDEHHLFALVASPLFKEWAEQMAQSAELRIFSFNWWQGARHLLTQYPVSSPQDLTGTRMRTIGAPVWTATISAMGATATPLSWAEVYSGLQQKVVDAAEAQLTGMWGARLYEVISHVTRTGHIQLLSGLVGSEAWFQGLSASQQQIIRDAAQRAGQLASAQVKEAEAEIERQLLVHGVVIRDVPLAPFVTATAPVYERLGYAELHQQVKQYLEQEQ